MGRNDKPGKKNTRNDNWNDDLLDEEDELLDDYQENDDDWGNSSRRESGRNYQHKSPNLGKTLAIVLLAAVVLVGGAYGIRALMDRGGDDDTAAVIDQTADPAAVGNQNTSLPNPQAATPAPAAPQAPWTGLDFETADTEGNTIRSQDLFSQHTVTMVNVWTSWCGYCVAEMPELERLNGEFAAKNCGIVGILMDAYDGNGLADGKAVMQSTGVTYPVLLPWSGVENAFPIDEGYPTTFFVDNGGHVIGEPIIGAYVEGYTPGLDAAIAASQSGNTSGTSAGAAAPATQSGPWTGISFDTKDVFGNPVNSQDLFSQHTMTMVNVWASWCGPCVGELPELQRLNGEFEAKNCAIVGILLDGNEAVGDRDGRAEMKDAGVTYTVLRPWDGVDQVFPVTAVPTSFFVDSSGNIIGEPIVGAAVGMYSAALDDAIAAAGN